MGKLDGRLSKLEATVGQADEAKYMQAYLSLQPKVDALYWQSREEYWPISKYLDRWTDLLRTLPPYPKRREPTLEERDRSIGKVLEKLNQTHVGLANIFNPHDFDALTQKIREEEAHYLREKERNLSEK